MELRIFLHHGETPFSDLLECLCCFDDLWLPNHFIRRQPSFVSCILSIKTLLHLSIKLQSILPLKFIEFIFLQPSISSIIIIIEHWFDTLLKILLNTFTDNRISSRCNSSSCRFKEEIIQATNCKKS